MRSSCLGLLHRPGSSEKKLYLKVIAQFMRTKIAPGGLVRSDAAPEPFPMRSDGLGFLHGPAHGGKLLYPRVIEQLQHEEDRSCASVRMLP
jgi:hypothetical protein